MVMILAQNFQFDFVGWLSDLFGAILSTKASFFSASMDLQAQIFDFTQTALSDFFGFILDLLSGLPI
jgi:hypothetical protein